MKSGIALVLFSGGQDSTTLLGWAKNRFEQVKAIGFYYGQKHSVENIQAKKICFILEVDFELIDISFLPRLVDSALTSGGDVNENHSRLKGLPASFVPNRNALFLTIAHAYAQKIGASKIIGGMCETDYSGYPDCRLGFIIDMQNTLNHGAGLFGYSMIKIMTPLMNLTKAQTFQLAYDNGIIDLVIEESHTCYNGNHELKHDWGYGCGECPACLLRKKGFEEWKASNI